MARGSATSAVRELWRWYPLLIWPIVILVPFQAYVIDPLEGMRLWVAATVGSIGVCVICRRLLGPDRGAVFAALVLAALAIATSALQLALFGVAIALLLVEARQTARGKLHVRVPWTRVTEVAGALLLVVTVVLLGRVVQLNAAIPPAPGAGGWTAGGATRPDIFLIVADGHARGDLLADAYGYDLEPFRSTLASLGFTESPGSWANHTNTRYSLSVLLNGRPLSALGQPMQATVDEGVPVAAITASSGLDLLRRAGYRIAVVTSGYSQLRIGRPDEVLDVGPWNELEAKVLDGTLIGDLLDLGASKRLDGQRERVLRQVAAATDLARQPSSSPLFVLVHLPVPHSPFVFDADCAPRPVDELSDEPAGRGLGPDGHGVIAAMRDQTVCTDRLLANLVREIVAARDSAVVILFSDHGPDELLDWDHPTEPGQGGRLGNLFWARTPGHDAVFPPSISLVNVLPVLFNAYLGTSLPTHPDDLYFGPTDTEPRFVPYMPGAGAQDYELR